MGNKKIIIIVVALILVGLGIFYLVSKNDSPKINSGNMLDNAKTSETDIVISMRDFTFSPAVFSVKTGVKVIWVNDDRTDHTIVSDTDNLLNSPNIAPGQSFTYVFKNPGTTNYHCGIHPKMKGTIVVIK